MKFFKEFVSFLREYKVISLAIAFIIGEASTNLINSLVSDIFLPLVTPLMSAESWKQAVVKIGPVSLSYGAFVTDFVNFVLIALLIFIVARSIIKIEKNDKK